MKNFTVAQIACSSFATDLKVKLLNNLNRTSGHVDFENLGQNYVPLSCDAPPDKSKHFQVSCVGETPCSKIRKYGIL